MIFDSGNGTLKDKYSGLLDKYAPKEYVPLSKETEKLFRNMGDKSQGLFTAIRENLLPEGAKSIDSLFDGLSDNSLKKFIDSLDETERSTITVGEAMQRMSTQTVATTKNMTNGAKGILSVFKNVSNGAKGFSSVLKGVADDVITSFLSIGEAIASTIGNMLVTMAATMIIQGAFKVVDAIITTEKEAHEKMEKSFSEYEDAQSEVETLNEELENTKSKIDEINAKENLSFTDQAELEKLKSVTEELETQLSVMEKIAESKAREAINDTVNSYAKTYGEYEPVSQASVDEYLSSSGASGNYAGLMAKPENINAYIASLRLLNDLKSEYLTSGNDEGALNIQQIIEQGEIDIWKQVDVLKGYRDKLTAVPYETLTSEEQAILSEIDSSIDFIMNSLDNFTNLENKINNIFADSRFIDVKDSLVSIGEQGSDAVSKMIKETEGLPTALNEAGVSAQELIDYIMAISNPDTYNLSNISDQLKENFSFVSGEGSEHAKFWRENIWNEFAADKTKSEIEALYDYVEEQNLDMSNWGADELTANLTKAVESAQSALSKDPITFSSLLSAENGEINTIVDNFQSGISSIQATIDSLKTGDSLNLTDLKQEFPDLIGQTEDLEQSLERIKEKKLGTVISDIISEAEAKGISGDEWSNVTTFIEELVSSIDTSSIDLSNVKSSVVNSIVDSFGLSTYAQNQKQEIVDQTNAWLDGLFTPKTLPELINQDWFTSAISQYENVYTQLSEAQDKIAAGTFTDGDFIDLVNVFPELATESNNLSGAIDNLLDSADSNIMEYFAEKIQNLRNVGMDEEADALQIYADKLMESVRQIEESATKIGGATIKLPGIDAYEDGKSSENEGKTYETLKSALKEAKDLYDQGLVGTDDFKKAAALFSPTGAEDYVNFLENYGKAERYLTDDSSGVQNFLSDLESKGFAEYSEETEEWTYNIKDLQAAADEMGMSFEWFMGMFGRLSDYGFSNDFVTSQDEGISHLADLYGELAKAEEELALLEQKSPENTTAIQAKKEEIETLHSRIETTKEALQQLLTIGSEDAEAQVSAAKASIEAMQQELDNLNPESANYESIKAIIEEQIQSIADKYHIELAVDAEVETPEISSEEITTGIQEAVAEGQQEASTSKIEIPVEYQTPPKLRAESGIEVPNQLVPVFDIKYNVVNPDEPKETIENTTAELPVSTDVPEAAIINIDGNPTLFEEKVEASKTYAKEQPAEMNIDGNQAPVVQSLLEAVKKIEDTSSDMNIGGDKAPALKSLEELTAKISNTTEDMKINANSEYLVTSIETTLSRQFNINVSANVSGLPESQQYTGTMLSPARASGTAYNMLNLKPAFANGSVALSQNEEALVNELGTESIIRDGVWSLIPGGMHVESLKKGDIILNARQTKDLMESGKAYGHGKTYGSAYANGTACNGIHAYAFPEKAGSGGGNGSGGGSKNKFVDGADKSNTSATNKNTSAINTQTKATKDNTDTTKKTKETFDDFIGKFKDWIEVLIQREEESKNLNLTISDNKAKAVDKNTYVDKALIDVNDLIDANKTGKEKYQAHADKVKNKAVSKGLVSKKEANQIVKKIKNGDINILDYDEDARKFIDSYSEW